MAKRVLVAMSGGVDSSAAAALLVDQGYEVIGATMQVWDYSSCSIEEGHGTCCSSIDVDDARDVADRLKIPFYVLNCEAKFKTAVIDPFIKNYLRGQTPLPCVDCNTFLKFDHLLQKMHELDCDYLATGHYAQIVENSRGEKSIQTSTDDWKDQTYFLFTIPPYSLKHLMFPIGHMKKPEVRQYAQQKGLLNANKKDSTGICFVGSLGHANFIDSQISTKDKENSKGKIKQYPSGNILGEHPGIHHFTYGQSKGLTLDHHEKLFVIKIDESTKTVWVGEEKYLFSNKLTAMDLRLLQEIDENKTYRVKLRYHHPGAEAKIKQIGSDVQIEFSQPQRAITPGQAAVIYENNILIGGAWIK